MELSSVLRVVVKSCFCPLAADTHSLVAFYFNEASHYQRGGGADGAEAHVPLPEFPTEA